MIKLLTSTVVVALMLPAAASAQEAPASTTFTRNGETYVYTAIDKGDRTIVSGRVMPSGRNFRLSVRGNRVRGFSDGVPVSFKTRTVSPSSAVVAAR